MKKTLLLSLLMALPVIPSLGGAAPKTVCTMTLNSDNEREALRKLYEGPNVIFKELVPENKDPNWLGNACRAQVQCDVLLISGHFGGVFFGETNSTTVGLQEMEQWSCSNTCPGIFQKPKDIFLMGCNTVSTKTKDKRTIEEYVQVLIKNGFPRDLAEKVAFARYSEYGMSIGELFSAAFPNAQRLHGFTSTGPMGSVAGPMLTRALRGQSAESFFASGPDVNKLKQAFAGTSFRIVEPKKEIDLQYKALSCRTFSGEDQQLQEAIEFITKKGNLKRYYEPLLEAMSNEKFMRLMSQYLRDNKEARRNVTDFFMGINLAPSLPLKMKYQLWNLQALLGIAPVVIRDEFQRKLIQERFQDGLDFIMTDQFCAMKDLLVKTELKGDWLSANDLQSEFLPRLSQCFGSYDQKVESAMKRMTTSPNPFVRREALRALSGRLLSQELAVLMKNSEQWTRRDRFDMFYSFNMTGLEVPSYGVSQCLKKTALTGQSPDDRDGSRWACYNQFENELDSPLKCQQVARQFETQSVTGMDWTCLTRFKEEIHLGACLEAAGRNQDPEKSDDMRWYCWSHLSTQNQLNRSECLALASSMVIQGNRFKANWNCLNRLSR